MFIYLCASWIVKDGIRRQRNALKEVLDGGDLRRLACNPQFEFRSPDVECEFTHAQFRSTEAVSTRLFEWECFMKLFIVPQSKHDEVEIPDRERLVQDFRQHTVSKNATKHQGSGRTGEPTGHFLNHGGGALLFEGTLDYSQRKTSVQR